MEKETISRRAQLLAEAEELSHYATDRGFGFDSEEDRQRFDAVMDEVESLGASAPSERSSYWDLPWVERQRHDWREICARKGWPCL